MSGRSATRRYCRTAPIVGTAAARAVGRVGGRVVGVGVRLRLGPAASGCRCVLELADRLRPARQRPAAAAPVGGHQPEQEDDRLAGDQQQHDHDEQQERR